MKVKTYRSKTRFWQTAKDGDKIQPLCNCIMFKNIGSDVAVINDVWTLNPNEETPAISQMHPEIVDETEYRVTFNTMVSPLVVAIIVDVFTIMVDESVIKSKPLCALL